MPIFHGLDRALRWLRLQHRRKQCEVARTAGITQAMLCSYEQGKRQPSLRTLDKILDALGVDLPDLFQVLEAVRQQPEASEEIELEASSSLGKGVPPRPATKAAPSAPPSSGRKASQEEATLDLYSWLDLAHRLPTEQEQALSQMLQGFLTWLRLLHTTAATRPTTSTNDLTRTSAGE